MKKLALLTSGGDAPRMNAAVRSVALSRDLEVIGIRHGYKGLLLNDFVPLGLHDVSNIIQRGGTILKTSRPRETNFKRRSRSSCWTSFPKANAASFPPTAENGLIRRIEI